MIVETAGVGTAAIIFGMALVTLATRWGGIFAMSFIPLGPRTRRFIEAMSGSVLVALLAPLALAGDGGARLALAITAIVMLVTNKPLPSIAAGIVAAALFRMH